jgi:CheY-like chemotaxis protein
VSLTTTRTWHILLVDDDPLVVKVYSERMRHEGWTVTVARDGYDANLECRRVRFDLILLDIRMPMQNGVEVLKEIRRIGINEKTPVYVLTSLSESEDVDDALRLGAEGVFRKSDVRPDDLVKRVSLILHGKCLVPRAAVVAPEVGGSWLVDDAMLAAADGEESPPEPDEEPVRPRLVPVAMDPLEVPAPPPPPECQYDVYVNPFLGDGAELLRSRGLLEPFTCPECGGQPCLRVTATGKPCTEKMGAAFYCSRCKRPL